MALLKWWEPITKTTNIKDMVDTLQAFCVNENRDLNTTSWLEAIAQYNQHVEQMCAEATEALWETQWSARPNCFD